MKNRIKLLKGEIRRLKKQREEIRYQVQSLTGFMLISGSPAEKFYDLRDSANKALDSINSDIKKYEEEILEIENS